MYLQSLCIFLCLGTWCVFAFAIYIYIYIFDRMFILEIKISSKCDTYAYHFFAKSTDNLCQNGIILHLRTNRFGKCTSFFFFFLYFFYLFFVFFFFFFARVIVKYTTVINIRLIDVTT